METAFLAGLLVGAAAWGWAVVGLVRRRRFLASVVGLVGVPLLGVVALAVLFSDAGPLGFGSAWQYLAVVPAPLALIWLVLVARRAPGPGGPTDP